MPRRARIVAVGFPHHITQRGNNKCLTFYDDQDYTKYLLLLEKYKNKYGLDIFTYNLMPNHVHIKAVPLHHDSMAKTMNYCQMCYVQYFNKKYKQVGHLWQSRFFSCPLDEQHSYMATKYIELNPVRANLVKYPEQWKWSSARDHLNISQGLISLSPIEKILNIGDWKEYLGQDVSDDFIKKINKNTLTGLPLGDKSFVKKIESLLGISVRSSKE